MQRISGRLERRAETYRGTDIRNGLVAEQTSTLARHLMPRTVHRLQAVYFDRLDSSEDFTQYLSLVRRAAFVDLASATNDERLAFFINIYNLMLMHITHRYGPPATIWQRRKVNSTSW